MTMNADFARTKRCSGLCKAELPLVCFWDDRTRPDGKNGRCKNCQSIWAAGYWKETYYPRRRDELRVKNAARNKARRAERKVAA